MSGDHAPPSAASGASRLGRRLTRQDVKRYSLHLLLPAMLIVGIASMIIPIRSARMLLKAECSSVRMLIRGEQPVRIDLGLNVSEVFVEGDLRMLDDPRVSSTQQFQRIEFYDDEKARPRLSSITFPANALVNIDVTNFPSIDITIHSFNASTVNIYAPHRLALGLGRSAGSELDELELSSNLATLVHAGGESRPLRVTMLLSEQDGGDDRQFQFRGLEGLAADDLQFVRIEPGAVGSSVRFRSSLHEAVCSFRGRNLGQIHVRYGEEIRGDFNGTMLRASVQGDRLHLLWEGRVTRLRAGFGHSVSSVMPSIFEYNLGNTPQAYLSLLASYIVIAMIFRTLGLRGANPQMPESGADDVDH